MSKSIAVRARPNPLEPPKTTGGAVAISLAALGVGGLLGAGVGALMASKEDCQKTEMCPPITIVGYTAFGLAVVGVAAGVTAAASEAWRKPAAITSGIFSGIFVLGFLGNAIRNSAANAQAKATPISTQPPGSGPMVPPAPPTQTQQPPPPPPPPKYVPIQGSGGQPKYVPIQNAGGGVPVKAPGQTQQTL